MIKIIKGDILLTIHCNWNMFCWLSFHAWVQQIPLHAIVFVWPELDMKRVFCNYFVQFPARGSTQVLLCPFLMCCGCDTPYLVSVRIQCRASIYTLSLCHGHSWRVLLAKQETLTPPGHLVSPLVYGGSVSVHRGALLLVPQWQCISSFVFY